MRASADSHSNAVTAQITPEEITVDRWISTPSRRCTRPPGGKTCGRWVPVTRSWPAAPLLRQCCTALLASYKIWGTATVGGNLCLSFPAGAMISLGAALDGTVTVWRADGGEY